MYALLGPLLVARFGLHDTDVLLVRLAGLPGMILAPLAGWLAGRFGAGRVAVAGFVLAAAGLAVEAFATGTLCAGDRERDLRRGYRDGRAAMITLVSGRAGAARGGALGMGGLCLFAGASWARSPLAATRLLRCPAGSGRTSPRRGGPRHDQ